MPDLATTADLEARLGRSLTASEQAKAAALLADASALIRAYTRRDFTAVTHDKVRLRPVGNRLRLPNRPVNAVHSVTAIGWAGIPDLVLPLGTWGWDGLDIIELAPLSSDVWLSLPTVDIGDELADTYEVDYDHGDNVVPDAVVAVCCGVVLRVLLAPSPVEGMSAERVGKYSYQMTQEVGGGSAGASVRLRETDKELLRQAGYGPRTVGTVEVVL